MFTKLIDTVIFRTAYATSYSCHKTADGLRATAKVLDKAGDKAGSVAVTHGLACGKISQADIDAAKAKVASILNK